MKKRIGITQRVVYHDDIGERRDVLDQRWYDFAEKLSVQLIPVPNNLSTPVEYVSSLHIEGMIFSGGNNIGISGSELLLDKKGDVAPERDQTEMQLLEWAGQGQKPVVGVCRGCQFINAFYGGLQTRVDPGKHVATTHTIEIVEKRWQSLFGSSRSVNSYHNWGIRKSDLANGLTPTVTIGDYIEGFQNTAGNLFGIMWHPERYAEFRSDDIKFFKSIFNNI